MRRIFITVLIMISVFAFGPMVYATVTDTTARIQYNGNGANDTFAYPFYVLDKRDLLVIVTDANGVETTQVIDTDYTVTGSGEETGGNVVFETASIPASTETVTILRNVAITQETDYVTNDPFPAESHEAALDKLTMIAQQHKEALDRAMKLPESVASGVSAELPPPAANQFLKWDSSATRLENSTGTGSVTGTGNATDFYLVTDYDDMADAVSDIGSTPATLLIGTTQTVNADLVTPANMALWFVDGAQLQPATGKTITINRPENVHCDSRTKCFGGFRDGGLLESRRRAYRVVRSVVRRDHRRHRGDPGGRRFVAFGQARLGGAVPRGDDLHRYDRARFEHDAQGLRHGPKHHQAKTRRRRG